MLTEMRADLFTVPGLDALAHGVNCYGVMGAGIAKEFKRRWPMMFEEYARRCRHHSLYLGDVFEWQADGVTIYNLATQPRPGPCARPDAIATAIARMVDLAEAAGIQRIGMPRIGSGLGGLRWPDVRPIIARAAERIDIVVAHKDGP